MSSTSKNEPTTKIPFPTTLHCSSSSDSDNKDDISMLSLGGVGVRTYGYGGFIKVYAVGAYFDAQLITMMEGCIKKEKGKNCNRNALEKVVVTALLNPTYPRTIRIVMNRALSVDTFVGGIVKSVEPRLKKGKEKVVTPETFTAFTKLFPKNNLQKGDEFRFIIRDDILLIQYGVDRVGGKSIQSRLITEALCDLYFGNDVESPSLQNDVKKGFLKL
mmetsp:Transcript_27081/g.30368  ORF Transcript_27081/g.30368 Transcript_27081/m.30368 type:complete len:217 (-) Transcript_27081:45-695(-)